MSLSNIDKTHLEGLYLSLYNDSTDVSKCPVNFNHLEKIKNNHVNYARLKQIAKDMQRLRGEAAEIVEEVNIQDELHKIKKTFRLTSGCVYYLYETAETHSKYFSMISPKEWNGKNRDKFIDAYLYDYDKQFVKKE